MSYEHIRTTEPKARKEYICDWCAETILIKEKYFNEVGVFDGKIQTLRFHNECKDALNKSDWYDEEFPFRESKRGEINE